MATSIQKRRVLLAVAILAGVSLLVVVGADLRARMGLEFSREALESLRVRIANLGWWAPGAFVMLVIFRGFLLVPSSLALILGGLAFGAALGTAYGAIGLFFSALMQFGGARLLGDDWVQPRLGERSRSVEARLRALGPSAVWLNTAHPFGLQTPINLGAGLIAMDLWRFALAVALAVPLRASLYALLGTSALDLNATTSLALGLFFVLVCLLPLANAGVRRRLLGGDRG